MGLIYKIKVWVYDLQEKSYPEKAFRIATENCLEKNCLEQNIESCLEISRESRWERKQADQREGRLESCPQQSMALQLGLRIQLQVLRFHCSQKPLSKPKLVLGTWALIKWKCIWSSTTTIYCEILSSLYLLTSIINYIFKFQNTFSKRHYRKVPWL